MTLTVVLHLLISPVTCEAILLWHSEVTRNATHHQTMLLVPQEVIPVGFPLHHLLWFIGCLSNILLITLYCVLLQLVTV